MRRKDLKLTMTTEFLEKPQNENQENRSEEFGNVPHDSERTTKVFPRSHRKETHIISVRDAAKMFEAAGVSRTERSITNWCWPNRQGLSRLDAYFDPNDRKYFITQQSIELAIKEELSKGQVKSAGLPNPQPEVPKPSEKPKDRSERESASESKAEEELRKEILDLKITNRAKDMHIERLYKDREAFEVERKSYIEQLVSGSRRLGELETRLLQLEAPREEKLGTSEPRTEDPADMNRATDAKEVGVGEPR